MLKLQVIYRTPITQQGKVLLTEKLSNLRDELSEVIVAIAEAKKQGDLSENFEYHAAKRRRSEVEKLINELDAYLKSCVVSKLPADPKSVCFGSKITLSCSESQMHYIILGEREADVDRGSISINSPLCRAMLGQKLNFSFELNGKSYTITGIEAVSDEDLPKFMVKL